MSSKMKRKPLSDRTRRKMSLSMKKNWKNPKFILNSSKIKQKIGLASKKNWKNPNSIYNSKSFIKRRAIGLKKAWSNPDSAFNSPETRRKFNLSMKWFYNEIKGKNYNERYGLERAKKIREKIGLKGKNHPFFGKHHSEKTKRKLRLANIGKKQSAETIKKKILALKGHKVSAETRRKISEAQIGRKLPKERLKKMSKITKKLWKNQNWNGGMKNKHHTKKTKQIIREKRAKQIITETTKRKIRKASKRMWKNPIIRNKIVKNSRKALNIKPNKPEKAVIKIIKENNFPFDYSGDGKVIFSGFNPDFISKKTKCIIEVNGDYWHREEKSGKKDRRKLKAYSSLGYKTLIIWEHELKEPHKVAERIRNFLK